MGNSRPRPLAGQQTESLSHLSGDHPQALTPKLERSAQWCLAMVRVLIEPAQGPLDVEQSTAYFPFSIVPGDGRGTPFDVNQDAEAAHQLRAGG